MIAARFRLVGWVAGCAGAALCCYMSSQSVAAERGALGHVESEIADTRGDIHRLQTEISARSRMGQIEHWNQTLKLSAARPAQYVASDIQLASLVGGRGLPLDPAIVASHGAVDQVAYRPAPPAPSIAPAVVPAPGPAASVIADREQPLLRQATYVRPKPDRLAGDEPSSVVKASFVRTSLEKPSPARMPPAKSSLGHAAAAHLDAGLLPSDLGSLIAAERGSAKHASKPALR